MKTLFLLLVCVLTFAKAVHSQSEAPPLIPVAQLREDLRIMQGALQESQVGLYWFISKPALEKRFQTVSAKLTQPMTAKELHRLLLPLVASLRHGHTTLNLPVQAVGYRLRSLDKEGQYFPFEVRTLNNRLYVVTDLSDEGNIAPGTEILAINNRPVRALLTEMRQYVSADGKNDSYKRFQLDSNYRFHFLLDLIYGASQTYRIEVVAPGKPKTRPIIAAVSPERMIARYRERTGRAMDTFPPALRFQLLNDKVALLTVGSFYEGLFQSKEPVYFKEFMTSAFRQIKEKQVQNLILDVRGNEGGNDDYVPLLYSFLADKPFELAKPTTLASASVSFLRYDPNPSADVKAFAAAPEDFVFKTKDGSWQLKEEIDPLRYKTITPQKNAFTGNLYVLIDGGSFSATNGFLDLVWRYHRAEKRQVRFVGETNGGDDSFGRVSGGQTLTVTLPNSKQQLKIPLLGFSQHFAIAVPKAVIPDDRITPSIQDVIAGVDSELRFVRELIAP